MRPLITDVKPEELEELTEEEGVLLLRFLASEATRPDLGAISLDELVELTKTAPGFTRSLVEIFRTNCPEATFSLWAVGWTACTCATVMDVILWGQTLVDFWRAMKRPLTVAEISRVLNSRKFTTKAISTRFHEWREAGGVAPPSVIGALH